MRDLLSTRDIAQMYQVTNATVLNWVHAGKLKAYTTPGGHYRVAREDLAEFACIHSLPPVAEASPPNLRLLLVGADTEFFGQLRDAILFRWPAAQVEHARSEFDIGWWLARMGPTHIVVHPTLTPMELLTHFKQLSGDAAYDSRLIALPGSPGNGLSEWVEQLERAGM